MTLTPHFTLGEAACHDGTPVPAGLYFNALRVADAAEVVRARWGLPLTVLSWYRPEAYNRRVGGAEDSMHVWALAMDVAPPDGVTVVEFHRVICELAATTTIRGIGLALPQFGNYVHFDCRPGAVLRQWKYPLKAVQP